MIVSELIETLKGLPQDLKITSHDYGDCQSYEVISVTIQKPNDHAFLDYGLGFESVLLR